MKKDAKFVNKESLVEATMLALQGKLNLQESAKLTNRRLSESIDVSVDDDGSTIVETDDATVLVQDKTAEIPDEVIDTDVVDVPEEEFIDEVPVVDEPVETVEVPVNGDETVLPEDVMEESKKITESEEDEEQPEDVSEEEPVEEPVETEEVPVEEVKEEVEEVAEEIVQEVAEETAEQVAEEVTDAVEEVIEEVAEEVVTDETPVEELPEIPEEEVSEETIDEIVDGDTEADTEDLEESKKITEGAREATDQLLDLIDEGALDAKDVVMACVKYMSEDDVADMCRANEFFDISEEELDEGKEPCKDCEECEKLKVSSKTFNEALAKYYKTRYKAVESFKTNKVLSNSTALKVEGRVLNANKQGRDVTLTFKKVQEGKTFVKYEMTETVGLLKESKDTTTKLNMMVTKKDNVLECKYLIRK